MYSVPADNIQLSLYEIVNRIQSIRSVAKRAGERLTGIGCVKIQIGRFRAVPAAVIIICLGKRWPIQHVVVPIFRQEPDVARAIVHGDCGSVLAGDHVVDETSDLIPASHSRVAGAGVEGTVPGSGKA